MKVYCRRLSYPNSIYEPLVVVGLAENEKIIDISGDSHKIMFILASDPLFHTEARSESFLFVWQHHFYEDKFGGAYREVEIANDYKLFKKFSYQSIMKDLHTMFVFKQGDMEKPEVNYRTRFDLPDD